MNILRELRKFKTKRALAKIRILILLLVMLIVSTYAWFVFKLIPPKISGLTGSVSEWEVEYSIDDVVIEEEEINIAVDEFYPGMDEYTKNIVVRNITPTVSSIKIELTSVKLFGEEILPSLLANNDITEAGTTKNIFSTDRYPFKAGYYYDKNIIHDSYIDESLTPNSTARITFFASWDYERVTATMTQQQNDELDTSLGSRAYQYYKDNETESALEITLKIITGKEGSLEVE